MPFCFWVRSVHSYLVLLKNNRISVKHDPLANRLLYLFHPIQKKKKKKEARTGVTFAQQYNNTAETFNTSRKQNDRAFDTFKIRLQFCCICLHAKHTSLELWVFFCNNCLPFKTRQAHAFSKVHKTLHPLIRWNS